MAGENIIYPYGAMYYRRPAPFEEDWERDIDYMKERNFNFIKHWAMWNLIHQSEQEFDFRDYDRLMDLCARKEMAVVLQVIPESAPSWLAQKHPESHYVAHDGSIFYLQSNAHNVTGGWPGLCADNRDFAPTMRRFANIWENF
jgi:beta-galactosidase